MKAECPICPHRCALDEDQTGLCGARKNTGGEVICENYGKIAAMALDPIEKKPLRKFYPGTTILSVGSYGCNLRCPWCQNHSISMPDHIPEVYEVSPEALVSKALSLIDRNNIGLAYTYNEPLIGYEYVMDCSRLAHEKGLKNALVTNGYINEKPLTELLPFIDAMNIDLKSFNDDFYKRIGGSLNAVRNTISLASKNAHVEVTTLIIPNENDSFDEMETLAQWIASVNNEIPLHISRFFPRHKYSGKAPASVEIIYALADIARVYLRSVYTGNC